MKEKPSVLVLCGFDGDILGVYSSHSELYNGVNYWCKIISDRNLRHPNKKQKRTLLWYDFQIDYSPEAIGWDYAFIAKDEYSEIRKKAIRGGVSLDSFPSKKEAEINLIKVKYDKDHNEQLLGQVGFPAKN